MWFFREGLRDGIGAANAECAEAQAHQAGARYGHPRRPGTELSVERGGRKRGGAGSEHLDRAHQSERPRLTPLGDGA